ncbi:hypothetical protein DEJ27_13215 [Curtobacterium sp. MCPF17_018]|nr:hypothetical protein DEJ27_13215 [Curtobacterium sp. MCPF17_018]
MDDIGRHNAALLLTCHRLGPDAPDSAEPQLSGCFSRTDMPSTPTKSTMVTPVEHAPQLRTRRGDRALDHLYPTR